MFTATATTCSRGTSGWSYYHIARPCRTPPKHLPHHVQDELWGATAEVEIERPRLRGKEWHQRGATAGHHVGVHGGELRVAGGVTEKHPAREGMTFRIHKPGVERARHAVHRPE
jgi:hypothetical protein